MGLRFEVNTERKGTEMYELLCRNRVEDYAKWRQAFDANAPAGRAAGLELMALWREVEDPNNVFFLLEVRSIEEARAFLEHPAQAEVGAAAGVIDGECHFVERGEA